jgi:NAD(P)-dependent dehydrogenase (short-subunit alcohol dehydrogenase family)
VVVVTGASAGVGRAAARRFARDGASVALLARGEAGLEGARRDVEAEGGRALVVPTDVTDPEQVEAAADAAERELGPIDVWVNCAMATVYAEFLDVEPDEFRRATDVNYHGFVWGTRSALRRMLPRDSGVVVQVLSALSYRGIPLQAPYCGAKHAAKGFTESVLTELRHRGSAVRIPMVQLPGLNTPQFTWGRTKLPRQTRPMPPVFQPEVAADAVHFVAHNDRREIWVGLPTVGVIAAEKLAPRLLDWHLGRTGYDGQQTEQPLDPERHDNLFAPVDEDRGAHGPFDEQAHPRSLQLELAKHRRLLGAAGLAALAAFLRR